jgi:hypothetical protein
MNMFRVLKYLFLVGVLMALPCRLCAQDLEYKMEVGGALGGSFYLGDANYTALFQDMSLVGGAVARYNFNPRMAVKGSHQRCTAHPQAPGEASGNDLFVIVRRNVGKRLHHTAGRSGV